MRYTCPKCHRELRNPKQWHNCVKVDIDSLFEGKSKELVYIFDKLLAEIMEWDDIAVSATTNCIVFVHQQTFLIVRPMKKMLDVKFYSKQENRSHLIQKSILYSGKFENHIRLSVLEDVTPMVIRFIQESYNNY